MSPAPSWEVQVWLPALVSPSLSHPEIRISDPHRSLPPLPMAPPQRFHHTTMSPRGGDRGSGQGHGVPELMEHPQQPLVRSTEEGAAREEYF